MANESNGQGVLSNVDNSTKVFSAFMVLGLTGLLFLIVFGNLSGNLGFQALSNVTTNESVPGINGTTYTLDQFGTTGFESLTVNTVVNLTNDEVINAANYTVAGASGTIVGSVGRTGNFTNITVSYTVSFQGQAERDSESVITNLTGGVNTYFTFANVWFTLLAVVLLIIIVMGVIGVVQSRNNKSGGFTN